MTAHTAITDPPSATPGSSLAMTIALRELRAGAGGLVVFVLCIALGVAAVAAIGSLAAAFDKALANQGRVLIGGDLSFEVVHRQATKEESAALYDLGQVSQSASFRAMARGEDGKSALVEVKAVDEAYPLYGEVNVIEPLGLGPAWREDGTVLVQPILLERLGLEIGDTLKIGEATTKIGGTLGQQPDRLADRLSYGPKVLMSRDTLDKTGLVQPGSLIRWIYRVKMPNDAGTDRDNLTDARKAMETAFPQSGFAIRDWTDPAPSLRRDAQRFTQFINFVGLTALLLGGIGVGNAIQSYMAKKRDIIATFKCLGATSRLVLNVYMIQATMLAGIGIVIGLAIGALAPLAVATLYEDALPLPLAIEPHPAPLIVAALAGLLTMVLFVLWPLGRASLVSPARLMRSGLTDERERSATPFAIGSAVAGLALFVLAIAASEERLVTAAISLGILVAFGLLLGFGALVQRYAARHRRTKPPAVALAWASIGAPGSLARAIAVSLGLGLGLLIAVALIHGSLLTEIESHVEVDAPAYYFLDVEPDSLAAFQKTAKTVEPDAKMDNAPMLRGRIVELKGVPVDKAEVSPDTRWVVSGDRGLTYTDSVPGSSEVEEGEWWSEDYDGPPLVSFDGELARGLGLKLGDMVTVNILGRNVEAKIASMRKIDWESLAINFVMVFSPSTLQGAPHRLVTTLELPKGTPPETEAEIVQSLAERFPLVTAIKIGDIVDAARAMLSKLMAAISATAGFTLLIGAAVLAGAVSAGQQRRTYLAVLYKTLGATRRQILGAELIEFGLLGFATALLAVIIATVTAWALCTFAFDITFVFDPWAAIMTIAIALTLVLSVAAITTWRVLSVKAAPYLRAE
ncbi:MAG: FtsX-like permease family protein [Methyloceanibacter sp.]|uniref:ABC transporter permease n=1 Tax=Methyloceanibacter sp. TaxID=1965321 RepID=UPI003C5072A8